MPKVLMGVLGFSAALLGIAGSSATAQTTIHVSWSKIEVGAWTLSPLYSQEGLGQGSVQHFLALATGGSAIGENLIAVWYSRGTSGWTSKSWSTPNPWEAIKSVKIALAIPDDEDDRWGIPGSDVGIVQPEAPQQYTSGVLADDVMASLVASSPDRDVIVQFLAEIGYKAADVPVEQNDGCTTNAKLDGMAAAMNEALVGDEETMVDRSMTAWIASGTAGCGVSSLAVEEVTQEPQPIGPFSPPTYTCTGPTPIVHEHPLPWLEYCTTLTWTETAPVRQRQTRERLNPTPPPTYQYCHQTRTGVRTKTTECQACVPFATSPPCPAITPPGSIPPVGTGCGVGGFGTSTTRTSDGGFTAWTPPCPF